MNNQRHAPSVKDRGQEPTTLTRTVAGTGTMKLVEVSSFDVFFTPIEKRFESLTRLARRSLNVPVAAITGIAQDEQWFKSVAGWTVAQLPLSRSLCRYVVEQNQLTVVSDLSTDGRYSEHPFVLGKPRFRFYAGCPLRDGAGEIIGTFCVLDVKPRVFTLEDERVFLDLTEITQRAIQSVEAGTSYRQALAKLGVARREAMVDSLTRIWNRRGGDALLRSLVKEADQEDFEVSACVIDVDGFKLINDRFGHHTGDIVLRKIAARLVDAVREEDFVCRIGGDEFLVVLPRVNSREATRVAERMRTAVSKSPIITREHGPICPTVSIGCACRASCEALGPVELIEAADQALLASKSGGRNQVRFASG